MPIDQIQAGPKAFSGSGGTGNYWKGIRIIIPGVHVVQTDIADNRYRVDIPAGKKAVIDMVEATSKIDPTDGDFEADVLRSADASASFQTIFHATGKIKILEGEHRGEVLDLVITELDLDDEIRTDLISNGQASGVEIALVGHLEDL